MQGGDRYYPALDFARGFAALAVFLYHISDYFGGLSFVGGSFLAVDLFFLMSGFVIAASYEEGLRSGQTSFGSFVRARVLRLYPLYLLACVIGLTYFLLKMASGLPDAPSPAEMAGALPATLLLLPHPSAAAWGFTPYPFAPSAWSLSFELWFNLLYALIVVRLATRHLWVIAILALGLLVQQG